MYIFLLCLCVSYLTYNYSLVLHVSYSIQFSKFAHLSFHAIKRVGSPLRLAAYWEQKSHQERWSAQYRRSRQGVKLYKSVRPETQGPGRKRCLFATEHRVCGLTHIASVREMTGVIGFSRYENYPPVGTRRCWFLGFLRRWRLFFTIHASSIGFLPR